MDLDIVRVIKSIPKDHGPERLQELITPWGEQLIANEELVDESHPRPLLARQTWQTLDGWWECAFVARGDAASAWRDAAQPTSFDQRIRVPFSPETLLSGVKRQLGPEELLWYHRTFNKPELPSRGRGCLPPVLCRHHASSA